LNSIEFWIAVNVAFASTSQSKARGWFGRLVLRKPLVLKLLREI
jgi:hypothetical protein